MADTVDGTIYIDTKINTNGFEGGAQGLKQQFVEMAKSAGEASEQIASSLTGGFSKSVEVARVNVEQLENEYAAISDRLKTALAAGDDSAAERLGVQQTRIYDRLQAARDRLQIEVADAARKQAEAEEREAERAARAAESAAKKKAEAEERAEAKKQKEFDKEARKNAEADRKAAEKEQKESAQAAAKFGNRISSIVSGALFFNVISSALSSLTREIWSTVSSTAEMKSALNNLKGAASTAAAPLVNVLSKALATVANSIAMALTYITRLYSVLTGKSLSALSQNAAEMNNFAAGAEKAKKSLAGFDELTTLQDGSSGGGGGGAGTPNYSFGLDGENSAGLISAAEKIKEALKPLQDIDFSKTIASGKKLGTSLSNLAKTIGTVLADAYNLVLVPLAKWTIEEAAPAAMELFAADADLISAAVNAVRDALKGMEPYLKNVTGFIGDTATGTWKRFADTVSDTAKLINEKSPEITEAFNRIGQGLNWVWTNLISPALSWMRQKFWDLFSSISEWANTNLGYLIDAFNGLTEFLSGVFSGNWSMALNGLRDLVKSWVNSIVYNLNQLIGLFCDGLNSIIRMANRVSFKMPDGTRFGVSIPYIDKSSLQIPYLASGAVIPPNAPFMAVLGDQRHGTNIEAPLATIQEAFRAEVGNMVGGMMAGFEASVAVQQQILEAIMGIEIGDTTIGEAAGRYATQQNLIRGGRA